jgi:hypothetical protein
MFRTKFRTIFRIMFEEMFGTTGAQITAPVLLNIQVE